MMIKKLSNRLINQIAAGEVVERPASVVKELVENSIDAGASEIEVKIIDGGKSFISIKDNGIGISKDDLPLAIERFATSKLNDSNLFSIHTFGFRGEALASICSIARVTIKSRTRDCEEAYELAYNDNGAEISPTTGKCGTLIEVRDLFYATPARLKFLKSTATEADACRTAINNIALSNPNIAFKYFENGKLKLSIEGANNLSSRVKDVLGEEFIQNTKYVENTREGIKVYGFIGVPNYNKSTSSHQWLFVNGRPIKDKVIASNIRNAYKSVIPIGQFPTFLLYLEIPADEVDVNVHPAKTEVRFRNSSGLISVIYQLINDNLLELSHQASSALSRMGLSAFSQVESAELRTAANDGTPRVRVAPQMQLAMPKSNSYTQYDRPAKIINDNVSQSGIAKLPRTEEKTASFEPNISENECEYGQAIAQIDATYIVSQKGSELFIIDQHAVCERITLEKLLAKKQLESQQLLIPEVIHLDESLIEIADQQAEVLSAFGVQLDKIASDEICIRGIPSIFAGCEAKKLVIDILEELATFQNTESFENKVRYVYATTACHRSVRAGKVLSIDEMNHLLRQMQEADNIAQCCHGRPSYIKFSANDLKKMFER